MLETFGGRVRFHVDPMSVFVRKEYKRLRDQLLGALPDLNDDDKNMVDEFALLMSATHQIDFHFRGDEKPALVALKVLWEQRKVLPPIDLLNGRMCLPDKVIDAWRAWFVDANELDAPAEQLPAKALTPEQKEELADPNSPLALGGKRSQKST
jgi:hypothetical protein